MVRAPFTVTGISSAAGCALFPLAGAAVSSCCEFGASSSLAMGAMAYLLAFPILLDGSGNETLSRLSLYRVATPGEPGDSTHVLQRKHLFLRAGQQTASHFAKISGFIRPANNAV